MKNIPLSLLMAATMSCSAMAATTGEASNKPTVVLVHGAFADGSAWNKIIPLLEAKGLDVVAVQDPLTTLSDDVATTRRALAQVKGPIVLVGHSYGGAVITEAAANNNNVKALVYVAAYAPSVGETVGEMAVNYPKSSGSSHMIADNDGFIKLSREGVAHHLAQDVSAGQAALMYATQKPTNAKVFGEKITDAAWEKIPSWYVVSLQDHMINADLQKDMAKKINAKVTTLNASHAPHISQPDAVANVILDAVNTLK